MPPVEVVNEKSGAAKRLKFVRNTSYNGTDYGPDYASAEADVDSRWSVVFLQNGRAVEVTAAAKGGPPTKADDPAAVQVRDPEPEHRDPQLPLAGTTVKKK